MNVHRKKGFTLIELLVVVAIISLLSSIVLASLKDARQKAKTRAFRAEVSEFANALELYRSSNGVYPGHPAPGIGYFYYRVDAAGTVAASHVTTLPTMMSPYMNKIPRPTISGNYFYYYYNTEYRCVGDTETPDYIFLVSTAEPGFDDWPYFTAYGSTYTTYRCFSL